MSIPISADKTLVWEDPKTSVKYHFRYLVGDTLEKYMEGSRAFAPNPSVYLEQAAKEVKAQSGGKRFKKGELQKLTQERAVALATETGLATVRPLRYARFLVDTFVCKWEGHKDLPEMPESPSSAMKQDLLSDLSEQIGENTNELVGLTVDEAKN